MKERLGTLVPAEESSRFIVRDLVTPGDFIVLVVPIDSAAPKGRLILPQQQTIRDLLDAGTTAIVVKETELKSTLDIGRSIFVNFFKCLTVGNHQCRLFPE